MLPASRPKIPLIQTVRRTSATVRTSEEVSVSGGEKARDMVWLRLLFVELTGCGRAVAAGSDFLSELREFGWIAPLQIKGKIRIQA